MNKKLMAVAVAGALGAPALAFAQASTVQVYGTISSGIEYRSATGADGAAAPGAGTASSNASSVRGGGGAFATGAYSTTPGNQNSRTSTTGSGSNFGLRGREDLGGGLYAGFQAELAMQIGGNTAASGAGSGMFASYRNTGLWLGTSVGEFGVGVWDTPFTINQSQMGPNSVYGNASTNWNAGMFGGLSIGQATFSGQTLSQYCGVQAVTVTAGAGGTAATTTANVLASTLPASTANCFAAGTAFNRRSSNSVWYQSPNWNGFSGRVFYAVTQPDATSTGGSGTAGTAAAGIPSELKPYIWGAGAAYTNGPLYIGVSYEKHSDYSAAAFRFIGQTVGATAAAGPGVVTLGSNGGAGAANLLATFSTANMIGSDDYGWNINARYNFSQGFFVGAYWERLSYSWNYGATLAGVVSTAPDVTGLDRNAYRLDGGYQTGPHTIALQYGKVQDLSGTVAPNGAAGAVSTGFNGNQTGVHSWMLAYAYSFSKRTSLFGYYNQVNNDTNARTNGIVFNGITTASGADPKYYGVGLRHTF